MRCGRASQRLGSTPSTIEVALGLELLGRLDDDADAAAESRAILERLGVRRVPEFPLARRTS